MTRDDMTIHEEVERDRAHEHRTAAHYIPRNPHRRNPNKETPQP